LGLRERRHKREKEEKTLEGRASVREGWGARSDEAADVFVVEQ
jgi:hypothetical protein